MLNYLNSRNIASKEDIAAYLETNERNVVEYRKCLEEAGYIINVVKGKYGGYSLDKSSTSVSVKLSEVEKLALLQAGENLRLDQSYVYKDAFFSAIGKVLSSTKLEVEDVNKFIFERFPLIMSKEDLEERYSKLDQAVLNHKKITMVYNGTNNKRREVILMPYKLFNSNQGWYVIGFIESGKKISQNPYFFKLNRIIKINLLNISFSPIKTFNISDYLDQNGMNYGKTYHVKVILGKPQNVLVQERKFGDNQRVVELDSSHTLLECDMSNIDSIVSFLLYFGHTAKLLEPKEILDCLVMEENRMIAQNKNKTVFFDFNGTIIDDVQLCLDILNDMLISHGHNSVSLERYKEIFTFPIKDYYIAAGFDFTKESFEDLSQEFINKYQHASLSCKLNDGVVDLIKKLLEEKYNVVLLTASEINNVIEQLKHFGLYNYFNDVLGTSNIYAKSKVEIGVNYINNYQIDKSKAIMIGDTTHDSLVAKSMGIDCILYSGGHQSKEKLLSETSKVIDNFSEAFKFINF